ncbi:hypothetical protein [Streptomyces sp. NPDC048639]|uniref:hypothetical protein n=1 Tax=Streptomyces sp. NPDC048639 TaxID=3365581 RepID=UPI00371796D2
MFNKSAEVQYGPADAAGGGGLERLVQQNIAQRGRRNNNCLNANTLAIAATGSRLEGHCADQDISRNERTQVKGGGAANGGTGGDFDAQQIAQSGRQNNNCASPHYFFGNTTFSGSRVNGCCGNKDASHLKHTWDESGGAEADGGEADSSESQGGSY